MCVCVCVCVCDFLYAAQGDVYWRIKNNTHIYICVCDFLYAAQGDVYLRHLLRPSISCERNSSHVHRCFFEKGCFMSYLKYVHPYVPPFLVIATLSTFHDDLDKVFLQCFASFDLPHIVKVLRFIAGS